MRMAGGTDERTQGGVKTCVICSERRDELILIHSLRGERRWTRAPVAWRAVQSLIDGFALYSPLGFVVSFCLLPFQT